MSKARAWQRMLSGRRLDLLDPSPLDIEFEDIAHGLARVARWNGQTHGPHAFSVAQHSLLVEYTWRTIDGKGAAEAPLYALLHDAPEYVIGDMISPFKAMIGPDYKAVEKRLQEAIHLRAGLAAHPPSALAKVIKKADRLVAYWEATALAGFSDSEAARFFDVPDIAPPGDDWLTPWPVAEAQERFLAQVKLRLDMLDRRRKAG